MANTYEAIATVEVGSGGAASMAFSSIPNTFTDLLLKVSARQNFAAVATTLYMSINGDTGANYSRRRLVGNGSSAASYNATGETYVYANASATGTTATSNTFGNAEFYIPNYLSAINKSISIDTVTENNATEAYTLLQASLYSDTTAITSLTVVGDANFLQYSTATLYGIKNS